MSATHKSRLFISYARADDEAFVERLYHDLKDDFDIWWDRASMPNRGLTFLQEIRDAIDWSDRLLLVAGPRAFTSDYVRDEWQYAYQYYKGINIALRLGDYPDFPEQLGSFDALDFRDDANYDERLATLKRQLAEPVAPIGALHTVPALPPHFLNRPDALDALRELVIADVDKPTLISSEKRTTAVEGMGGIGKSVIATAFAYDRKVRFAFPDGIIWLTVGRTPSMYDLYRVLGVALGDDLSKYPDEPTARQNAQKALTGKKCLIILDDVWELSVGRSFRDLIANTPARLLMTTRNLQINNLLNANEYRLKLIDESQSLDYLRSWVGDDPQLGEIAERLGYLFLALKLAGALMKENGLSGAEYLSMFELVSDMEIADDSLEVSINLGVDAAFVQYDDRKLLYYTFGIFDEDVPVPQQTVLQLWSHLRPDIRPIDHLKTLTTLVNLGLVERDEQRTITLHDLLHDYTREKLGERTVQTHQDLLASYKVEQWHELSQDEPYLWRHIGYHLKEAGQLDILHDLLLDFDFLSAKLHATDTNALIADCNLIEDDEAVRLVKSALSMSAHVLANRPEGLDNQLLGRLNHHKDKDGISGLYRQTYDYLPDKPRLRLVSPTLQPAGGALIRTLEGHTKYVNDVALAGEFAVSASFDKTLRVWNWQTGEHIRTLEGHTRVVASVALSGEFAVSASVDGMLRVWNWTTGEHIRTLEGHTGVVPSVALSGDFAVSASEDKALRVWNWARGEHLRTLEGHTRVVASVALSGEFAVSASHDRTLRVWNWTTGEHLHILEGHTEPINSVVLSGNFAVSASRDKTLRVWNWTTGEHLHILEGHTEGVNSMALAEDFAVSASSDKTLRVWNWRTGEHIRTLGGHTSYVYSVALSGKFAVSASHDRTLRVWNWTTDAIADESAGHTSVVNSVALSKEVAISASGDFRSRDNTLRVWNWATGEHIRTLKGHTGSIKSVALSGEFAVSTSSDYSRLRDNTLRVWNWRTDEHLRTLKGHTDWVNGVALSGEFAVSASSDKTLRVWNWRTGKHLRTLEGHSEFVSYVALSEEFAVSASGDETLRVWNWQAGEHLRTLRGHTDSVYSVALVGDFAVSASGDETFRVWNWRTGKHISTFERHTHSVLALLGEVAVAASWDGTLRVGNWRTGKHICTFYTDSPQNTVAIDPDARIIVSGGEDGKVHFWKPNETLRRMLRGG